MTYSKKEWLHALRKCERKHGTVTPSIFDDDPEFPSYTGAANSFGSWAHAKELAGVSDGDTHECPECGGRYRHLIKHWNSSSCRTVEPTERQLQILTGLLMGDGTLLRGGPLAGIAIEMTNREYLSWVDSQLGLFSTGVRIKHSAEEQLERAKDSEIDTVRNAESLKPSYRLLTRKFPSLNRFRQWYSSGTKRFPTDLSLTPTSLRHWYCCDGTLSIPEKSDKPSATIISMNEADREAQTLQMFGEIGLEPRRRNGRYRFPVGETERLLSITGPAPPGFEYKWAKSSASYQRLKC